MDDYKYPGLIIENSKNLNLTIDKETVPKQLLELSIVGSCAGTRDRRRETGNVRQKTCSETVMGEYFF